jgi:hypothetical protein
MSNSQLTNDSAPSLAALIYAGATIGTGDALLIDGIQGIDLGTGKPAEIAPASVPTIQGWDENQVILRNDAVHPLAVGFEVKASIYDVHVFDFEASG